MLQNNPHAKLIIGSVYQLPFADNSFDIVFCSDLLHHLDNLPQALTEMSRVTKKYIVVSEPNCQNPLVFLFSFLNKEERGALKFNKKFLANLLTCNDLEIINILTSGLIFPNKTPWVLPFLKFFDKNNPFGSCLTIISKKKL